MGNSTLWYNFQVFLITSIQYTSESKIEIPKISRVIYNSTSISKKIRKTNVLKIPKNQKKIINPLSKKIKITLTFVIKENDGTTWNAEIIYMVDIENQSYKNSKKKSKFDNTLLVGQIPIRPTEGF